jgi:hypothetical protein
MLAAVLACRGKSTDRDAPRTDPVPPPTPAVGVEAPAAAAHGSAAARKGLEDALRGMLRVAMGDLDGDGSTEIVAVDAVTLHVLDLEGRTRARIDAPGGIQVLRIFDLDGDGRAEIAAGWGRTKARPEIAAARASLLRLREDRLEETVVVAPRSERAEIVDIQPIAGSELLVAHFESKYMVAAGRARDTQGHWTVVPIDSIRMATAWGIADVDGDGSPDVVVGRLYGDDLGLDGDAFVRREDGERVPIPVVGGVRSMVLHDLDGDGVTDVLLGDGWNQDYGKVARDRLSWARWTGERFETSLLEQTDEQYAIEEILPLPSGSGGSVELLSRGSTLLRRLRRVDGAWTGTTLGRDCADVTVGSLGRPAVEVLALCSDGVVRSAISER